MPKVDVNVLAKAVASALTADKPKAKKGKKPLSEAERAAFRSANDAICVEAFTKAGFKDVQPRVNVMTYKRFVEAGRKVRPGEKSTKVGPFALFHVSQTDVIPLAEQNAANTQPA